MKLFKKIGKGIKKSAKSKLAKKFISINKKIALNPLKAAVKSTKFITKKSLQLGKAGTKLAVKAVKNITAYSTLAPLLPFRSMMKKQLGKKGIKTSSLDFPSLVKSFYNNVVVKSRHMDEYNLEEIPDHYDLDSDNFVAAAASVVIAIINFIKELKKKKDAVKTGGAPLSKQESEILADAKKVEAKLKKKDTLGVVNAAAEMVSDATKKNTSETKMTGGKETTTPSFFTTHKKMIIILVVAVIGIIVFLKMKK